MANMHRASGGSLNRRRIAPDFGGVVGVNTNQIEAANAAYQYAESCDTVASAPASLADDARALVQSLQYAHAELDKLTLNGADSNDPSDVMPTSLTEVLKVAGGMAGSLLNRVNYVSARIGTL